MIYSDEHRFCYYNTPKAASTALATLLCDRFGARKYVPPGEASDRHGTRCPAHLRPYFQFATVRHPLARALSGYAFVTRGGAGLPVPEAFERFHLVGQALYLSHDFKVEAPVVVEARWADCLLGPTDRRLDAVLHTETLLEEFNNLPFVTEPLAAIPRDNRTPQEWLTPEIADEVWAYLVEHRLADFEPFGYEVHRKVRRI